MDCITLGKHLQGLEPIEEEEVLSLYRAFEQLSDHRHKRGVRYPLAIILASGGSGQTRRNDEFGGHCRMGALAGRQA